MSKEIVTFYSEGEVIVADLYKPDDMTPDEKRPVIVMCQGFTGIRDMMMPEFAKFLVAAGYVCLALDYRGFGDSGGERGRFAPLEQIDDIRNALTWVEYQPFADPKRLGLFGASFGGLNAPYAAAVDDRVKAVCGWLGVDTGYQAVTNIRTPEQMAQWEANVKEARRQRVYSNVVDRPLRVIDVFLDDDSVTWLGAGWEALPKWRTPISFHSIGKIMEYRPIDVIHRISPRPLMLVVAERDTTGCPKSYRRLFDAAQEPKEWLSYDCGHYDLYSGELLEDVMAKTIDFFKRRL